MKRLVEGEVVNCAEDFLRLQGFEFVSRLPTTRSRGVK